MALCSGTDQGVIGDDIGHKAWVSRPLECVRAPTAFVALCAGTDQGTVGDYMSARAWFSIFGKASGSRLPFCGPVRGHRPRRRER